MFLERAERFAKHVESRTDRRRRCEIIPGEGPGDFAVKVYEAKGLCRRTRTLVGIVKSRQDRRALMERIGGRQ